MILWAFSLIKVRLVKNPARLGKDKRLENILSKHDEYLKLIESKRRMYEREYGPTVSGRVESNDLDTIPDDNPQIEFMREVLYNYVDKDLKQKRVDY